MLDDHQIRDRMLDGDEEAFAVFFETYFQRLYRFASRRVQRPDVAEDIVQATLITAVRKIGTWRGEAALYTWLCTLCRHELARHWARSGRQPAQVPLDDEGAVRSALESLAALSDPTREAERREIADRVQLTLDALPDRYGDVLEWKYIEGWSVDEIAARLGRSAKAVESVLSRAREAFREAFSEVSDASTN